MRAQNREQRTEDLLRAALSLFLDRGIEEVTIDDIVGEAGVAKGSFYRYFDDKAHLVEALFGTVAPAMRNVLAECTARADAARGVDELVAAYLTMAQDLARIIIEEPRVVRLYLQESRAPERGARKPVVALAREVRDAAIRLTEVAQRHGAIRPMDPRIISLTVVGATERLIFAGLTGEDVGPLETVPEALVTLIVEGIRRPNGPAGA